MPIPWLKRIRQTGQLTVHNKAGAWTKEVAAAIVTFNNLGFGVQLVNESVEKSANIVVKLSDGSETYQYYGDSIIVKFDATKLHGKARTLVDMKRKEIFFAAVFLPGNVPKVTAKQKEVVAVHELIHAAGLNGMLPSGADAPNDDHASEGIMFGHMKEDGDGLLEYLADKGAQSMPPIRVSSKTMCDLRMLWGAEVCK